MKIGELFVALKFKGNTHVLTKAKEGMVNLRKSALLGTTAITGMGIAFGVMSAKIFSVSNALSSFHVSTGLSTQKLQRFSQIAELSGSNANALQSSVEGIQQAQAKLNLGQGNTEAWSMLGLNPKDNPFDTLKKLRVHLSQIKSPTELAKVKEFLGGVGINKNLLPMLRLTDKQFKDLRKHTKVLSENDIKNAERGRIAFHSLMISVGNLRDKAMARLAPLIEKVSKSFEKWLSKHGKEFVKTLEKMGGWLIKMVGVIPSLINKVDNIVKSFGGWKNVLMGLGIAFAALKLAPFLSLLNPITIALAAAAFVIGEIAEYANGSNNLFAKWAESMPAFKVLLDGIVNTFTLLKDLFTGNMDALGKMAQKFPTLTKVVSAFWIIGKGIFTVFRILINEVIAGIKDFGAIIGGIWDVVTGKKSFGDAVKGTLHNILAMENKRGYLLATWLIIMHMNLLMLFEQLTIM